MQKPSQVYGRCSEGAERFPEGTQKEKGREGEGEGDVILLMLAVGGKSSSGRRCGIDTDFFLVCVVCTNIIHASRSTCMRCQ